MSRRNLNRWYSTESYTEQGLWIPGRSNSVVGSDSTDWNLGVVEITQGGEYSKTRNEKNPFVLSLSSKENMIHMTHESTPIWIYNDSAYTLRTH